MTSAGAKENSLGRLLGLGSLFSFIYCVMASHTLIESPLYGGALYMCAQVAVVFFSTYTGAARQLFTKPARRWRTVLLTVLLLAALALAMLLPERLSSGQSWMIFALVMCLTIRDATCRRVIRLRVERRLRRRWFAALLALLHGVPALVMLWVWLWHLPSPQAWALMAGYGLCDLAVVWNELTDLRAKGRIQREAADPGQVAQFHALMRTANAFRIYEVLSALIVIALYVTTVVVFALLAMTAEEMLWTLLSTTAVSVLSAAAAEGLLRRRRRRLGKTPDPTNVLLIGLFLWIFGLSVFRRTAIPAQRLSVSICLSMAFCVCGVSLCLTALNWLEGGMRQVARFTAGSDLTAYDRMRDAGLDLAMLIAQMLAMAVLTLLTYVGFQHPPARALAQPILLLPASLLVIAALVFLLRFPISARFFDKLDRFLHLTEEGEDNKALRDQLEKVVQKPFRQPFATRLLRAVIRTVYRHRLVGLENLRVDDGNPMVFLCNHSEIYGPVVAISCIPVPVRPWVISRIAITNEESIDYIYRYDTRHWKWLPAAWRRPAAELLTRLSTWCMNQLECIPVYRDKPGQLMKTFRASVEALQAGDNLLIFPENPNAAGEDHGFEREGVGTLFSGFAMLGQIYHSRTGKQCRFVPMYCDKHTRTITFAKEIVFRVDADPEEERRRVAAVCEAEMNRIWQEDRRREREQREARASGRGARKGDRKGDQTSNQTGDQGEDQTGK